MNCVNDLNGSNKPNEPVYTPRPPVKLTRGERNSIIVGSFGIVVSVLAALSCIVPWKTIQAFRRPYDLFKLYGYPSFALFLFGSRTTWRTEAYVLGKMNDNDALNFKKSVQEECTVISVAVRLVCHLL
jgi:hypothetical protein